MPFCVREVDVVDEVARHESVIVVICRFCPAASMAARYGETYLEPLRRGLNTARFEEYVEGLVARLEDRGVRIEVVRGGLRNLVVCMWTEAQKEKLRRLASEREAILVIGCRGAFETVSRMVESTGCRVYHGMEDEAILSVTPKVRLPLRITLEPFSMTSVSETRGRRQPGANSSWRGRRCPLRGWPGQLPEFGNTVVEAGDAIWAGCGVLKALLRARVLPVQKTTPFMIAIAVRQGWLQT